MTNTKTAKAIPVTLDRIGSHSIRVDWDRRTQTYDASREEVFLYFTTTWRGEEAHVTVEANRYRHSEGMSEWRIFANDCRKTEHGTHHTDTAKRRLSDMLRPIVETWLAGTCNNWEDVTVAEDFAYVDYATSERNAYNSAIRHEAYDLKPYLSNPTSRMREYIASFSHKLTSGQVADLLRLADKYDAFSEAYNGS